MSTTLPFGQKEILFVDWCAKVDDPAHGPLKLHLALCPLLSSMQRKFRSTLCIPLQIMCSKVQRWIFCKLCKSHFTMNAVNVKDEISDLHEIDMTEICCCHKELHFMQWVEALKRATAVNSHRFLIVIIAHLVPVQKTLTIFYHNVSNSHPSIRRL